MGAVNFAGGIWQAQQCEVAVRVLACCHVGHRLLELWRLRRY
jgi:hypothetical protein